MNVYEFLTLRNWNFFVNLILACWREREDKNRCSASVVKKKKYVFLISVRRRPCGDDDSSKIKLYNIVFAWRFFFFLSKGDLIIIRVLFTNILIVSYIRNVCVCMCLFFLANVLILKKTIAFRSNIIFVTILNTPNVRHNVTSLIFNFDKCVFNRFRVSAYRTTDRDFFFFSSRSRQTRNREFYYY